MNHARAQTRLVVGAILLAFASIASGALIALSGDERAAEAPSPTPDRTPTARQAPTPTPTEAPTPGPTDYAGKDAAWWFRVEDGLVTRIEQQFLP